MKTLSLTLSCTAALLLVSCGEYEYYRVDGHAQVSGNSIYARPVQVVKRAVAAPAPQDSNIAYYVPANTVPRSVREIRIVQKAPEVQQPSPQELLRNEPEPIPEPVVEDSALEPIPDYLLEQPAGTASPQVSAGSNTL